MLNILEKISAVYAVVVTLAVAAGYALYPPPDITPREFLPEVEFEEVTPAGPASRPQPTPGAEAARGPAARPAAAVPPDVFQKLRTQGVPVRGNVEVRKAAVPRQTFERLRDEADLMQELRLASSRPILTRRGPTRLRLQSVAENSLLRKYGLQEGDVIELIDGEIIEFNESSSSEYFRLYREKIQKLESGGTVSVTITRNGKPVHLVFSLK